MCGEKGGCSDYIMTQIAPAKAEDIRWATLGC